MHYLCNHAENLFAEMDKFDKIDNLLFMIVILSDSAFQDNCLLVYCSEHMCLCACMQLIRFQHVCD